MLNTNLRNHHAIVLLHKTTKMFTVAVILSALLGASAFSSTGMRSTSSKLQMSFESAIGAQPPLGFFDPLGLLKDADQERFDRLRKVEIKHGRISMLAVLGHLTTTAGIIKTTSVPKDFSN